MHSEGVATLTQDPPPTESISAACDDLDLLPTADVLARLHAANTEVLRAVQSALPLLEQAVHMVVARWAAGGRLILVGAGTSGRVAAAEAAECPPTFGTDPERIVAVIAGGPDALLHAIEGAEDDERAGASAMERLAVRAPDIVVGVSASGGAPFVVAALRRAVAAGAAAIALTAAAGSPLSRVADLAIVTATGPEAVAGSTRMKAGTAQKLVLNLLTTAAMVRLGHVHGCRMVDFHPTNAKLRARAIRTVVELASVDASAADAALRACGWQVKPAIVAARHGLSPSEAERRLQVAGGNLRQALSAVPRSAPTGPPPPAV